MVVGTVEGLALVDVAVLLSRDLGPGSGSALPVDLVRGAVLELTGRPVPALDEGPDTDEVAVVRVVLPVGVGCGRLTLTGLVVPDVDRGPARGQDARDLDRDVGVAVGRVVVDVEGTDVARKLVRSVVVRGEPIVPATFEGG